MAVEVAPRDRVAEVKGPGLKLAPGMRGLRGGPVLSQPLRPVAFRFDGRHVPDARHVLLVSSFNRWDQSAHGLTRREDHETWSISVMLPVGEYPYLFIVDGVPWNDPLDDGRTPCEWGGDYSVRVVR